jgi:hypothetical protein
MFELRVPFFKPLWRRIALTAVCLGWAGIELTAGAPGWSAVFAVLGAYAAWQFFLTGWPGSEDG